MNKIFFRAMLLLAVTFLHAITADAQVKKDNTLLTDSVKYDESTDYAACSIIADFPRNDTTPLAKAVTAYIKKMIEDEEVKSWNSNKEMVEYYGKKRLKELNDYVVETKEYDPGYRGVLFSEISVRKKFEKTKFVTYAYKFYSYGGGAHGITVYSETTFIKATGKTIDEKIFKNANAPALKRMIINGLKKYFEVKTDAELKECLFPQYNLQNLPLSSSISFGKNGVIFQYQHYEIAAYAYGMPAVVIPYKQIMPYIAAQYQALLPK